MNACQYNSIFTNEININIANYLTELVIFNRLNWLKQPKPACAFWRKEFYEIDPTLKKLYNIYKAELTAIQDLLKTFSPVVLAEYFKKYNVVGIKTVKKVTREKILYHLQRNEKEYQEKLKVQQNKVVYNPVEYGGAVSRKPNNKMGLLNGED